MEPVDVCIATQTPLIQFLPPAFAGRTAGATVQLDELRRDVDYRLSPGGVTRMIYPLARRMIDAGRWRHVHWVALNPNGPSEIRLPGITLHHVQLDPGRLRSYGAAKEAIWSTVHGLRPARRTRDLFWSDEYGDYTYYNRRTAEEVERLDAAEDFDAFYIHDFQLLPLGGMIRSIKPKVFRWHLPFDARLIPRRWVPRVRDQLAVYDAVVVSAERYRDELRRFGFDGRVERVYPFVDPTEYAVPTAEEIGATAAAKGVAPSETVVLVVGRMDPTKRQDRVIEAFARLGPGVRAAKLVVVGNGSFSSAAGGPAQSKGEKWRRHLERTAEKHGVADRVVFTGHVTQHELDCWYERARFTVLASGREGFGLVVVESWLHGRPAVVGRDAGVADLVVDGGNGALFEPDEPGSMADAMSRLLSSPARWYANAATAARSAAEECSVDRAIVTEAGVIAQAVEA